MRAEEIIANYPRAVALQPRATYDNALVGVSSDGRLIYSESRILIALQDVDGKTYEEALDHYAQMTTSSLANGNRFSPIIATETT
jgi:hypothetical protein